MTQQQLDFLRREIAAVWTPAGHKEMLERAMADPRTKDPQKRARWDWLWRVKISSEICRRFYAAGLNDTHIDTALRQIIAQLLRSKK